MNTIRLLTPEEQDQAQELLRARRLEQQNNDARKGELLVEALFEGRAMRSKWDYAEHPERRAAMARVWDAFERLVDEIILERRLVQKRDYD